MWRILRWIGFPVAIVAAGVLWLYAHWIGFPRHIAGHWVHPRVTWLWTGLPGYPFPATVAYVYTDEHGRQIKHGPFIERGVRSYSVVVAKTGFYLDDQPDGVFVEYQTYWGTKLKETRYSHGKKISEAWYRVPPLGNAPGKN